MLKNAHKFRTYEYIWPYQKPDECVSNETHANWSLSIGIAMIHDDRLIYAERKARTLYT